MNCIEVRDLSYSIGTTNILKNVNLSVPNGSIYGFLGPNGAGKSTTIRLLLNLYQTTNECISMFGKTYENNRTDILRRIGSLIETPSLYSHLSGYDNLKITQTLLGLNESRIDEVLEIVNLEHAKDRRVQEYSLGMKQRLGIALSLLGDSELLILDEPINGLDPKGIIEIRELLLKLNQDLKKTIFISSHILSEIDKIATHLSIINKGCILFEGTLEEFRKREQPSYLITTSDVRKSLHVLNEFKPVQMDSNTIKVKTNDIELCAKMNEMLINAGIGLYSACLENRDLEALFLQMTEIEGDNESTI